MMNLPHLMVLITVFSFMLTVVNLLPAFVASFQERSKNVFGRTTREMDKFFVNIKITHILIGSLALGGLLGVATRSVVVGIACMLAGAFAPKFLLSIWKNVRSTQFDAQLMDALILISNALKSGLDIATGIELVTTNLTPPISEEFGLVLNAYRLGSALEGSLMEMTHRIQSKTLETAVGAIVIQRETGGNLVKTFDQLIQTIREETKLQKKVRALSTQGRTQIAFLAFFPWAVALLFYFMSPEMFQPALAEPMGRAVLAGMVVWEFIGILVTKRIVTVDV
jgi:tight adherence protein B